jgi:hypothetical protein
MTLFADDADARVDFQITDSTGGTNDWATPTVNATSNGGTTVAITAVWQGDPGASRVLRVPMAGLTPGRHRLRLVVPDGNDVDLDAVYLH